MTYHFDVGQAEKYGLKEAVMLQNIIYWIRQNIAARRNYHDGRTWTYDSIRAYGELFPFWSEAQIRRLLASLLKQEVLVKGNYNVTSYDRTLWYALKDETVFSLDSSVQTNSLERQDHLSESTNPLDHNNQPIPDKNTDRNTDKEKSIVTPSEEPEKEDKNEKYVPLARLLYESHRKLDDKFLSARGKADLEKTFLKWAGDIRLLIERDGRDEGQVRRVILWTQESGNFWNGNILSGYKLRKQFPTLVMQKLRDQPTSTRESKYYERNKDALKRIINGGG